MAFRAWQQRLPLALPAEHRTLPRRAGGTAETITAMAAAWEPFGGSVSIEAFPHADGFHIHDAYVRPLPASPAPEGFDLGRDPATGNLLDRMTLHAASRLAHTAPVLTDFVRLFPSRFGWSAYTIPADAAVVSLAALDLQLTGDPALAQWYLSTTDCPAWCLNHADLAAVPTRADVARVAAPYWPGLPALRWRTPGARPTPLDTGAPGAHRHPFFDDPEPEHTLRCRLDAADSHPGLPQLVR